MTSTKRNEKSAPFTFWFVSVATQRRLKRQVLGLVIIAYRNNWHRSIGAAVLIAILVLGSTTLSARADEAYFYSPLCLGDWKYAHNTEGEPELLQHSDIVDFNSSNSALLENASGRIFCGKFQPQESLSGEPQEVRVHLLLAIQAQTPIAPFVPQDVFVPTLKEVTEALTGADGDPTKSAGVEPTPEVQGAEDNTTPVPEKPAAKETKAPTTTSEPEPSPSAETTLTPTATLLPTPLLETPSITPEPSSEPVSFWKKILGPTVHAAEEVDQSLNLDTILEVGYTLDGENWQTLGYVGRNDWRDVSFGLPITAWDQIDDLQISVSSLPISDGQVSVWLDGVWLQARDNSGVVSRLEDVGQAVLGFFTFNDTPTTSEQDTPLDIEPDVTDLPASSPEPYREKIVVYHFSVNDTSTPADLPLDWYPKEKLATVNADQGPEGATIKNEDGELTVLGNCQKKYFVVLLYAHAEDYALNPSSAVYNSAFTCFGNFFSYTINNMPPEIDAGTYFLLIAEQDEGPWVPISRVYQVGIVREIQEKVVQ